MATETEQLRARIAALEAYVVALEAAINRTAQSLLGVRNNCYDIATRLGRAIK